MERIHISEMKRIVLLITVAFSLSAGIAMNFKPPTSAESLRAIGSTKGLSEIFKKALEPGENFEPVPVPEQGDWLAVHPETGQSFDEFVGRKPNRPDKSRNKIYLQPLGKFPKYKIPLIRRLQEYASAYFGMQVQVLEHIDLSKQTLTTRINPYIQNRQILTSDVLALLKKKLPPDAFCILAVTMEDLYPQASWNFVFGQASLRERAGVYSFARYDPDFYGQKRGKDYEKILLRRSCKVLAHEISHMFGLEHCIYFKCVLNGSNHLKESDSRPMHLCPVCLHKLQYSIGFDVVDRYVMLLQFYKKAGFDDEAQWTTERLKWILGAEKAKAIIEQKSEQ